MIRLTDFPDDILEDIFHAMRNLICFPGEQDYHPIYYSTRSREPVVSLWANVITLSHVCRHWRGLMLTRPHLWTFIRVTGSFSNRIMVNEMIERSGSFPLSVLFTDSIASHLLGDNDRSVYDLLGVASVISDYSERIQELGIILRAEYLPLVMGTLSKSQLPILEKLWLDHNLGNTKGLPYHVLSISDCMVPPLRVLHAHRIDISWLLFENLERLELVNGPAPPLSALLHTLRHSPLLRILVLRIPSDSNKEDSEVEDEPRALLPCLRRLELHVGPVFDGALSVLPHIMFPPTATVALSFPGRFESSVYEDSDSLEELAAMVEHVSFVLHAPTIAVISSPQPSLSIHYKVTEDEDEDEPSPVGPIARLCEGFLAIPLPALTSLSITTNDMWEPVLTAYRFARLFEAVPTIIRLVVDLYCEHAVSLFEALGTLSGDEEPGSQGAPVCPELEEFAVNWLDEPAVDEFWCLERCCHARASAGVPIGRLETLAFPPIVLASLEHSVPTIVVLDGLQGTDDLRS